MMGLSGHRLRPRGVCLARGSGRCGVKRANRDRTARRRVQRRPGKEQEVEKPVNVEDGNQGDETGVSNENEPEGTREARLWVLPDQRTSLMR